LRNWIDGSSQEVCNSKLAHSIKLEVVLQYYGPGKCFLVKWSPSTWWECFQVARLFCVSWNAAFTFPTWHEYIPVKLPEFYYIPLYKLLQDIWLKTTTIISIFATCILSSAASKLLCTLIKMTLLNSFTLAIAWD
jgi:hypothetical protein